MQALVSGHPIPRLRSRKALWLLALLTMRGGRPVEREWLAGTLWPDTDQDRSLTNLRSVLSDLRVALGTEGERLRSPSRHTLSMDIIDADVDVIAFGKAIADNTPASLARAVALYRGPLLEGCAEEWVGQEREAREQDCLRALSVLAEAALAIGDWKSAADYSRRAVSLDPWRDGARRGLMEALARDGDVNAALQVYREFVTLLRDDPAAAPDEQTSALYARLREEARGGAHAPVKAAPAGKEKVVNPALTGHLPHTLTDLIGREEESIEVAARLRRSRLVTLTGPGGIGKTRLALAIAANVLNEYPGGVWLVALESITDDRLVASQVARTLGVREEAGRTLLESMAANLREKRLLLVLDNCEHVLEASAQIVAFLLRECAGVRVLATSRESLGIMGETAWRVPSLPVPDLKSLPEGTTLARVLPGYEGVRLFLERAQESRPEFELTKENAPAVAEVCARLEGIPLALELASARLRAMTVEQMLARLGDHLSLLTGGDRAAPSRQHTLRATLDWSHALLSVQEQLLLARMSVFAGGWTLEAAETVCSGEGIPMRQVLDLLTGLADKSLAVFEEREEGGRYRLQEMVRQYAAERLGTGSAAETVRARHRDYFLALAEEAGGQLRSSEQAVWLGRLEAEHDNLRAALARCGTGSQDDETETAELRLAGSLWRFWELRGYYSEGRTSLVEALDRNTARKPTADRGKALNAAGVLAFYQGDYTAAQALHEESLTVSREIGDKPYIALSLKDLGKLAGMKGDYKTARALYYESLAISREVGDRQGCAELLNDLGSLAVERLDYAAARALHEESLEIARGLADTQASAWSLLHLGGVANVQGDQTSARIYYEESLTIFREQGNKQGVAWAVSGLGKAAFKQEDYLTAKPLYEECLSIFQELGNKLGCAWSLETLGVMAMRAGRLRPAHDMIEESLSMFRDLGNRLGSGWALNHLANIAWQSGDIGAAQAQFTESLALFRELDLAEGIAENLKSLEAMAG